MRVGIGLPNAVRGVSRAGIVQWAQRAERAGFASLGTLDRLVYANYESLIALAAAAAVTERIELVTDILIAPLRSNTALLAKQAATIDSLSGGRLTLGLAPGGRRDDFEASGVDFSRRGRIFDQQLEEMAAVWRGERGIGPAPRQDGRPGLLIGGRTDAAYQRAATYADGWTIGGGAPDMITQARDKLTAAWSAAGRTDRPKTMALFYFALGGTPKRWPAIRWATTTPSSATTPSRSWRAPRRTPIPSGSTWQASTPPAPMTSSASPPPQMSAR